MKALLWLIPLMLGVALCVAPVPVQAGGCAVNVHQSYAKAYVAPTYNNVKAHANVYHDEYKEVKKVVVLEYVPLFAVGYAPAYAPPTAPVVQQQTAAPCDVKVSALEAKLLALESRLSVGAPPPVLPQTLPITASLIVGKCAACHDATIAAAKGKGLALTSQGHSLKFDDKTYGSVLRAVSAGTMPKGGKLIPEDFNKLLQELVDMHGSK